MAGNLVLIGLGSNLGDRKAHLDFAVAALSGTPGVVMRAVSSFRETLPAGGPGGQGAFLNAAASLETSLEPLELLDRLLAIEAEAGRVRTVRWGERTLDLDLLLYGSRVIQTPRLQIPHPRIALRRFVLGPLAEIAPGAELPVSRKRVSDLLANLDRRPSLLAIPRGWASPFGPIIDRITRALGAVALRDPARREALDGAPPWLADTSPDRSLSERAYFLLPATWADVGDRWLVADFTLADSVSDASALWDVSRDARPYYGHVRRWLELEPETLRPTFTVALPTGPAQDSIPCPGIHWPPRVRVAAGEPEAIVSEVLAACAATRSG